MNYQTLCVPRRDRAKLEAIEDFGFDILIMDEAHHAGANTYYNGLFTRVPAARKLGFTATPWHNTHNVLKDWHSIFTLSLADAVNMDTLSVPQLHSLRISKVFSKDEDLDPFLDVCTECTESTMIVCVPVVHGAGIDREQPLLCARCARDNGYLIEEPPNVVESFRHSSAARHLLSGSGVGEVPISREMALWALLTNALDCLVERRHNSDYKHKMLIRCNKMIGGFEQIDLVERLCGRIIAERAPDDVCWSSLKVRTFVTRDSLNNLQEAIEDDTTNVVLVKSRLGEGYDEERFSVVAIASPINSTITFSQLVGRSMRHRDSPDNVADVFAIDEHYVGEQWIALSQPEIEAAAIPDVNRLKFPHVVAAIYEMQPPAPLAPPNE